MARNVTGAVTGRSGEEGKSAESAVAGPDASRADRWGVDGWGVTVRGRTGEGRTSMIFKRTGLAATRMDTREVGTRVSLLAVCIAVVCAVPSASRHCVQYIFLVGAITGLNTKDGKSNIIFGF